MRLDHLAYRVKDKHTAALFFAKHLGYKIVDTFDLKFDDGSTCKCFAMQPPEKHMKTAPLSFGEIWFNWMDEKLAGLINYHMAPEIFVSEGKPGSIVDNWVEKNGPGIHHLAYEVQSVEKTMKEWQKDGVEFLSEPLICEDGSLVQVFTKPHPITGMTYELIERRSDKGFCRESVKSLMESTV